VLFYFGWALLWPSWGGILWVLLMLVLCHIMIITEEEHLQRTFGREYEDYCSRTPRYLGLPKR
jgi:protein-S-isoprenylcysteine O-methyltransferase Ste14